MLRAPAPRFWRRLLGATVISISCVTGGSLAWALQSPPTPGTRTDSVTQDARLRLRGLGSALRSNDPVVVVDGVRVYAAQAEAPSGKLADGSVPAPSPLDQIDPNIIETIEVFKGPSAATLYGADAANGVVVVTTKKGRP